jgi:DNA-binding NarL/FixJ family response regulator
MIHLVIIDRSRVFVDALADRLGTEPDIRVLRCATGSAALRQALDHSSADVVLTDAAIFDPDSIGVAPRVVPMPRRPVDGRAALSGRVGSPGPAVVLLGDHDDCDKLATCVRSGILGWVPRSATIGELIAAIRAAADGGTWIPPKVMTAVLSELISSSRDDDPDEILLAPLTRREREVLACLVDGMDRAQMAARLQLSTNTVRTHVQSVLSKLGVSSCLAAVALVRRTAPSRPVMRVLR